MMMQFDVDLILMIIWNWIKKKWGKSFYISSLSALPPNFFSLQSTQFLPNWNKKKSPQAKSSWAQLVCRSKNLHFPKAFKKSSWHFRRLMSKKSPLKKAKKLLRLSCKNNHQESHQCITNVVKSLAYYTNEWLLLSLFFF